MAKKKLKTFIIVTEEGSAVAIIKAVSQVKAWEKLRKAPNFSTYVDSSMLLTIKNLRFSKEETVVFV